MKNTKKLLLLTPLLFLFLAPTVLAKDNFWKGPFGIHGRGGCINASWHAMKDDDHHLVYPDCIVGGASPSATPSESGSPTPTSTGTPEGTATATPTTSPTATPTETSTGTPTSTPVETPTATPAESPTASPTSAILTSSLWEQFLQFLLSL